MNINFDLNYWGGKTYRVRLEESLYDIDLIVIYNRYGDEFMRIRTKDGQYFEYGYYNDRKHFTDEDSTICDDVIFCYYKGKIRSDKSITKRTLGYDDWCCESYEINCKQFR